MTTRSYNQFCALAYALDAVGERWTLLIVRELMIGPRRFKDLVNGLPDISTNLLSERLKALEQQGIIARRVLPPPAGSTVYELTPFGQALESALIELGRWGSRLLPPSLEGVSLPSSGSMALAMKAFFHPEQARGVSETYELHLDDEVLQISVRDGALKVYQGAASRPAGIFHTDMTSFLGLFTGQLPPEQALAAGLVRAEGDPDALRRFLALTHVPQM